MHSNVRFSRKRGAARSTHRRRFMQIVAEFLHSSAHFLSRQRHDGKEAYPFCVIHHSWEEERGFAVSASPFGGTATTAPMKARNSR